MAIFRLKLLPSENKQKSRLLAPAELGEHPVLEPRHHLLAPVLQPFPVRTPERLTGRVLELRQQRLPELLLRLIYISHALHWPGPTLLSRGLVLRSEDSGL